MAIRKLSTSSIKNNIWYRSMSAGSVFSVSFNVDYLVIAGGAGGGSTGTNYCGGGGAGGYRTSAGTTGGGGAAESPVNVTTGQTYTVTVGAGGGADSNGANSVFASIISTGGGAGRGNAYGSQGFSGGSGGGGTATYGTGGARTTTPVQGNIGGNASSANQGGSDSGAGGGGGAGGAGEYIGSFPFTNGSAPGGLGLASTITGSSVTRAAGGTGSGFYWGAQTDGIGGGTPGVGGGPASRNGTVNTGSGGGGGRNDGGGSGGSGVVILRYPSNFQITGGAGLTLSTATVGGNKVTTFTAGTGTISFS